MEVLMDRVLELDEGWNDGAIHAFMITYAFARQGTGEDPADAAKYHYRRALELSEGRQIGPHVSLAESLAVQTQDSALFGELLRKATAFDVNTHPETRLVNLLMQQRAHWLLDHEADLILPALEDLPPIE
jgi:predicted anti-sigma-YlaC factor YlaD